MKKQVGFAVAGFGNIGKRHAEEIASHADASLIAILETDPAAIAKAKEIHNVPVYADIKNLVKKHPETDVINICTPNGLHIVMATQAIDMGINITVEKPMGLHKKDCDNLISLAKIKNKQVFCVLQNRYSPPSQLINKVISEKRLGKVYWVSVTCFWNRDERYYIPGSWRGTLDMDGGPLYTQFSHFIDLLYWNFGPLKNIQARFYNNNHHYLKGIEDTGTFSFEFERGGAGEFTYSTSLHSSNLESCITIIGEKGTIKAGGQYMEKIDYFNVDGMKMPGLEASLPPNDYGHFKGSAANHAFVIDNIVKALNGESYQMASANDAAASVEIIEEVYKLRKF